MAEVEMAPVSSEQNEIESFDDEWEYEYDHQSTEVRS
jgi:hypothetical protein